MKITKICGFAFGALALGVMTACSNDNDGLTPENPEVNYQAAPLVRSANVIAWSGEHSFGNTFEGTRSITDEIYEAYEDFNDPDKIQKIYILAEENAEDEWKLWFPFRKTTDERGLPTSWKAGYITDHAVSDDEATLVINWIKNHQDEGYTDCDLKNFYIQNVESVNEKNLNMAHLYISGKQLSDKLGEAYSNYSFGTNSRRYLFVNFTINEVSYIDGDTQTAFLLDQTRLKASYKFYYVPLADGEYGYYLAINYNDGHEDYSATDDDYSDWVIKLIPVDGKLRIPEGKIRHNNEVEVNFSINDKHTDDSTGGANYDVEDLVSKLSIHVRYAGDVEVFIPVGPDMYCEVDDFNILHNHEDFVSKLDEEESVSYDIYGNTVTLTVKYEENGIRITTEGINEAVMAYCWATYGDGLNFEVYNYFSKNVYSEEEEKYVRNGNLSIEELKDQFDGATIKFLGTVTPNYYINAFGSVNEQQKDNDCIVSIHSGQKSGYATEAIVTNHLNGSAFNYIYVKNGVEADNAHVAHIEETDEEN